MTIPTTLAGALMLLAGTAYAQPTVAEFRPIVIDGANYATPTAVNASGEVSGYAGFTNHPRIGVRGLLTQPGAGAVTLIDPIWEGQLNQVAQAQFLAINDGGQAAGWSYVMNDVTLETHAVIFDGNELIDLGLLGGNASKASDINNNGTVVGTSTTADFQNRAFIYDNGTMTNLGALPGGTYSEANAINDAGTIVGYSTATGSGTGGRAVMWVDGVLTDMGNLGTDTRTYPNAISESGLIAGSSDEGWASSTPSSAWLYNGEEMIDLGVLATQSNGTPFGMYGLGVNNAGQVVGYTDGPNFTREAFLYDDGQLYVMNDLLPAEYAGWNLRMATAINDQGWITGIAYPPGDTRAMGFALRLGAGCAADLAEPFGTLNFFDVAQFISLYNAGDPAADLAEPAGVLNFFDVSEYVSQYNAGCP